MKAEQKFGTDRFPHPLSAWWIIVLLVVGWGGLWLGEQFFKGSMQERNMARAMAWGMAVTLPCTLLSILSGFVQAFRLVLYVASRPRRAKAVAVKTKTKTILPL